MQNYQTFRALYDSAMDLAPEQRRSFLTARCANDPAMLSELLNMIDISEKPPQVVTHGALCNLLADIPTSIVEPLPARIGRYHLDAEIGIGGMGRVFRARAEDSGVQQWVALKLIRADQASELLSERFARERQILARLNHPGIAHFIEAGSDHGTAFVAMELVDGVPILDYAHTNHISIIEKLKLFRQLLSAVAYAHSALVIHRDIKPSNVFVRSDGIVKLLDFGIAKPIDQTQTTTRTQDRMFTLAYAAPEQIRGDDIDVATDIYALGAVLYELISGCTPFDTRGVTPGELEHRVLLVPPPTMQSRMAQMAGPRSSAHLSQDIENIVQKALRKDRRERYRSVDDLDADIERYLTHRPVTASKAGMAYRLRKFLRRNALATTLGTLSIVSVLTALTVVLIQNRYIKNERDRSILVLSVMKDAFKSADPTGMAGGRISARDILKQSRHRVLGLANADPNVYLELVSALSEVELSLGMSDQAASLLDTAIKSNTDIARRNHPHIFLLAANAALDQEDLERARRYLRVVAQGEEESAAVRLARGRLLALEGNWRGADQLFAAALESHDLSGLDRVQLIEQRVIALCETQNADGALLLLARSRELIDPRGPDAQASLARLELAELDALRRTGRYRDVLRRGTTIRDGFLATYGPESSFFGLIEFQMGVAASALGEYRSASEHLDRSSTAFDTSLGPDHRRSIQAKLLWGSALANVPGRAALAERVIRQGLSLAGKVTKVDPRTLLAFRIQLSKLKARSGTLLAFREALDLLTLHEQDPEYALIIASDQAEAGRWLNGLFWKAQCARGDHDRTPLGACKASLQRARCGPARDSLCALAGVTH